jgi:hypothetical protein
MFGGYVSSTFYKPEFSFISFIQFATPAFPVHFAEFRGTISKHFERKKVSRHPLTIFSAKSFIHMKILQKIFPPAAIDA